MANPFLGMSRDQLQLAYTQAQQALIALTNGSKGESFSYSQSTGAKTVTFTRATIGNLQAMISQLQVALGMISRARRPIRFTY